MKFIPVLIAGVGVVGQSVAASQPAASGVAPRAHAEVAAILIALNGILGVHRPAAAQIMDWITGAANLINGLVRTHKMVTGVANLITGLVKAHSQ
jgi:hypothetical protein